MRKWRTRYPRRAGTAPGSQAITVGQRRRRWPRLTALRLALVALAVLAIGAVVTAADSSDQATSPSRVGTAAGGAGTHNRFLSPARNSATRRRLARDMAAIDGALRYTPFLTGGLPHRRMIALTFDDGPSPYTPQIIRILLRMHAPATFFIVGQQLNNFSAGLRDEVQHGFTIGDHTENHALLSRLSPRDQYGQIRDAATRAQHLGAPHVRLFRPPYGAYNKQTIAKLHALKMLMVLWSVDPGDWRRPGVGPIVNGVLANARAGAVVILHDGGGDRSQTVAALPAIINGLRKRHFQLVSVPELIASDPPPRHQRLPHLSGV